MTRLQLVSAAAALTLAHSMSATADEGSFYGLLRSRDLTAFGFLRLDMRPAHAVSIEPGSWAIETELGYQNTWALSPEVEKYLVGLEPTGRRTLGPAEVAAIEATAGRELSTRHRDGGVRLDIPLQAHSAIGRPTRS